MIPDIEISPMGVAERLGVAETIEYIPKKRITHDLSWPGKFSKESINSRIDQSRYKPIMFGHCLLRLIHHIIHLRKHYPTKKIFIRKEDLKSAYRLMHLNLRSAKKSVIKVKIGDDYYIVTCLRLLFGGASCPADFCLVSDIITDNINDLLAS